MTSILDQDIMYLPGVGPKRKEILSKELNVQTWRDLLEYYPYKYVDRSKVYAIDELNGTMPFVQIKGKILSFEEFSNGARKKRIVAHFTDGHGVVDLVWFRGAQYIYKTYTNTLSSASQQSMEDAINSLILKSKKPPICSSMRWACSPITPQLRR